MGSKSGFGEQASCLVWGASKSGEQVGLCAAARAKLQREPFLSWAACLPFSARPPGQGNKTPPPALPHKTKDRPCALLARAFTKNNAAGLARVCLKSRTRQFDSYFQKNGHWLTDPETKYLSTNLQFLLVILTPIVPSKLLR